jgi:uncharacterized protein DUF5335
MSTTKQLPRAEWKNYFERFTRERLQNDTPGAATVEVVSPTLGDQFAVSAVRLLGLAYDPKSKAFEVLLEDVDHLTFQPTEIWILEGEPGFISTIEVGQPDGGKEIIYVRRSGPLAPRYEFPSSMDEAGAGD